MKNIFSKEITEEVIERINKLTKDTQPIWGTMSVAQMLAHCNVTYEMVYTNKHQKPNAFTRWILKTIVKRAVVSEKLYPKNSRTAPQFLITDQKDFLEEKKRLEDYIIQTQELGKAHFHGKESNSFGKLTSEEWNNMFYKHLDHHLTQFGV
ncbi:DUF1569 domain-containing protein [Polaribacter dokdonensis]|uniref:DUF1569 domain-containing protein n=1 Tax=Polaribacter dokdonensis DSW-5 TaxID=1300348 RepID=A0A0N0UNS0_9FLAO|nr:DUF1569 domain-containing protein [Polaribacter dokdonensis]KOY52340.1 hypothetical protein I602_1900 [Polaribacter dokdonensis DSW-5]SEE43645.1 Protein of unknown function [Polaribacter dokdonensis DSW-5]